MFIEIWSAHIVILRKWKIGKYIWQYILNMLNENFTKLFMKIGSLGNILNKQKLSKIRGEN